MTGPIALIARDHKTTSAWCDARSSWMPGEAVVPFADLTATEKAEVQIAIVANPDPDELTELHGLVWIQSLWAGVERLLIEMGPTAPPIARLARTMSEAVLAWTYYLQPDMPAYRKQLLRDIAVGLPGLSTSGTAVAEQLTGALLRQTLEPLV